MSKAHPPELKKFMDKKLSIKLNAGRAVTGVLRGFDPFMNLVLDESVEECKDGQRNNIGMVVAKSMQQTQVAAAAHEYKLYSTSNWDIRVIRGNSIIMLEALDRI